MTSLLSAVAADGGARKTVPRPAAVSFARAIELDIGSRVAAGMADDAEPRALVAAGTVPHLPFTGDAGASQSADSECYPERSFGS
ncbi:MAG: hypothetical protein HYV63_03860 [Candidatus Schekmanbacteria bacterium]|nr:hypothetical protein [Candidatus Schekmanbacteria bacterium]